MNMKEHSYKQEEEPSDEKLWDQKCWSRLCRITATGIHDDAGNWLYSILIAALAQCAGNVPDDWRIAKFVGQSKYITGDAAPLSDKAIEYVGDILEALGGFVTWEAEQSRRFCKYHDISELKAKEFMSKINAFVQSGSILISTCEFSAWHATVNFLLHGTPEWQKAPNLWSMLPVFDPCAGKVLPRTGPHNSQRLKRMMPIAWQWARARAPTRLSFCL